MYGLAPAVVMDEMDARDVRDLFSAGLRFEKVRGALWLATLVGPTVPADPVYAPIEQPADPDEYQPPDRAGFRRAVQVM